MFPMNDPRNLLQRWFADAESADPHWFNAAALATADAGGAPSVRIVLVKTADTDGFEFFTNLHSRKARDLRARPRAALCLHWPALQRQLRLEGTVSSASDDRSDAYFATRDRASQIGAWASGQSQEMSDPADLADRVAAVTQMVEGTDVRRPPYWGGYVLTPDLIEFWTSGEARLHDRQEYRRVGSAWTRRTLYP